MPGIRDPPWGSEGAAAGVLKAGAGGVGAVVPTTLPAAAASSTVAMSWPGTTVSCSLTRMPTMRPSEGALTSMVTLSVSTCAITSFSRTWSPADLSTADMLPSEILSPMGGTRTCTLYQARWPCLVSSAVQRESSIAALMENCLTNGYATLTHYR